jgi:DNA topoisomerase I
MNARLPAKRGGEIGPVKRGGEITGLVYSSDSEPGIRRVRRRHGFEYRYPTGDLVRSRSILHRISALTIPPAWETVWICPDPRGHIQATGRDARGRKQFRYHDLWTAQRDESKFSRIIGFCQALPRIRRRVAKDLRTPGLSQEKVVAAIVRLLETTLIRVGNEEYAKENRSFGLTTLRDRHAEVRGRSIRLTFRGKSGRDIETEVTDRRAARVVKQCQELPGQLLFVYLDEKGKRRPVSSEDVNAYLRDASGADFTAKDFRTWAGTVLAAVALRKAGTFESEAEAKHNVVAAIDRVARRLGNTRAVCRHSYVHPAVIESYLEGSLEKAMQSERRLEHGPIRSGVEADVVALLRRRLREQAKHRTRSRAA